MRSGAPRGTRAATRGRSKTAYPSRSMEEQEGGLLVVMAHADDESMGSGGLILRHTRAGIATHLICATYGEAGWTGKPPGAKKEDLAEIRAQELEAGPGALALSGGGPGDYPPRRGARAGQAGSKRRAR